MDVGHCVIAKLKKEVAKFLFAADKRCYNVFSICLAAPPAALAGRFPLLRLWSETTLQNYDFFAI